MDAHWVINFLRRGKVLAAPVSATDETRFAWVGIYPLDLSRPLTIEFLSNRGIAVLPGAGPAYHVRAFEVDRTLIEQDLSIGETEMTNNRSYVVLGDDDLVAKLDELGVAVEQLDLPFKSNYPI
jgi:hypothetical protein